MDSTIIRDTIIQKLRNDNDFNSMVVAEINGFHFSAADLALPDSDGNCEVYRIVIAKHNQQKKFT